MIENKELEKPLYALVSPETKKWLSIRKITHGFNSLGEVLDDLVIDKRQIERFNNELEENNKQ